MPTYEYLCQDCGERLEVFQRFTDKALRVHPACGGSLQKVFHPSGVVFKGSGYYVTDSRSNGKSSAGAKKTDESTSADSAKKEAKDGESAKAAKTESSKATAAAD